MKGIKIFKKLLKNPKTHRILLLVAFLALLNLIFPHSYQKEMGTRKGDIAEKDIIAPYTFEIKKSATEIEKERREARDGLPPVLLRDKKTEEQVLNRLSIFFNRVKKTRRSKRYILMKQYPFLDSLSINMLFSKDREKIKVSVNQKMKDLLKIGVCDDLNSIPFGASKVVDIKSGAKLREKGVKITDVRSAIMSFKEEGIKIFGEDENQVKTFVSILSFFLRPNLYLLKDETERRREDAEVAVKTTKGVVLKGEMIVRAHDVISEQAMDKINSLTLTMGVKEKRLTLFPVGRNIIFILAAFIFWCLIHFLAPSLFEKFSSIVLVVTVSSVVLILSSLVIYFKLSLYLFPTAIVGVLLTILLSPRIALASVIVTSLYQALFSGLEPEGVFFPLFVGMVSVLASSKIKKFSEFYKPILYIAVAGVVCTLGVEAFKTEKWLTILKYCGFAVVGGTASTAFSLGLLPIFERIFGITTDITLVELADLNRPILRDLSLKAPGTYNHSISVANLVEVAAREIGANPILTRVGAYYHDIGKLKKPLYFIENQSEGFNPHDSLKPRISSSIIQAHVKDGVELAKKEKLPREVIDIIREHHGTTLIEIFYKKAQELDGKVEEEDFRYKGPLPHSKESALVMLADSCEAEVRSLENPSSSRIKNVIKGAVERRLAQGQLMESDITLKDIKLIEESFFPILMGVFHPRISYPDREPLKTVNRKS